MASGMSEACCNIPPVVAKGYKERGEYVEVDGFKIYRTGPATAKSAIFVLFDIFGYWPQTIQGCDILAYSDENHQYQVFMPDFFHGKPFDINSHPPDTDEKKAKFQAFFEGPADISKAKENSEKLVKSLSKQFSVQKWASLGMCWGAKVVSYLSQKDTPFSVAGEVHPAFPSAEDAAAFTIPVIMLASSHEPADDVKAFGDALKVPNHVETFQDQVHGWMAARANFEDKRAAEEYVRGYKTLLEFYAKHL